MKWHSFAETLSSLRQQINFTKLPSIVQQKPPVVYTFLCLWNLMASAHCVMCRGKSLVDSFNEALSDGFGCTLNISCSCIGKPRSTQKPQRDRNSFSVQTHKALSVHYVLLPHTPSLQPLTMAVMVIGPSRQKRVCNLEGP